MKRFPRTSVFGTAGLLSFLSACPKVEPPTASQVRNDVGIVSKDGPGRFLRNEGDTYFFAGDVPLNAGQYIVSTDGEGFLRRIVNVTRQGSELRAVTQQANLTEVIDNGSFAFMDATAKSSRNARLHVLEWEETFDNEEIPLGHGFSAFVDGKMDLSLDVLLEMDIANRQLDHFMFGLEGNAGADLTARISIEKTFRFDDTEKTLAHKTWYLSGLVGGWLPVVVAIEGRAGLRVEGDIMGELRQDVGVVSEANVRVGAEYRNSTWNVLENHSFTFEPRVGDFCFDGSATPQVILATKFSAKLYGVLGPTIGFEPYGKFAGIGDNCRGQAMGYDWKLTAGAIAPMSVDASIFGGEHNFYINYDLFGGAMNYLVASGTHAGGLLVGPGGIEWNEFGNPVYPDYNFGTTPLGSGSGNTVGGSNSGGGSGNNGGNSGGGSNPSSERIDLYETEYNGREQNASTFILTAPRYAIHGVRHDVNDTDFIRIDSDRQYTASYHEGFCVVPSRTDYNGHSIIVMRPSDFENVPCEYDIYLDRQ